MPRIDFARAITAEAKAQAATEALIERVRLRRNEAMAAGISVGGVPVYTDDLSQQRIIGAALAVKRDPDLVINWKTAGGFFVPLDAEAVLMVADAVRVHIQACFDHEAVLLGQIEAGGNPDIDAGWPAG
jgi:hypothetical protein